jgi:hypothetical protein
LTRARLDGLYLLLIGCAVFTFLGVAMENALPVHMADFSALYFPARCLIQYHDPYKESEVRSMYLAEGGSLSSDIAKERQIATQNPYPPSAFFFTLPFALLPLVPAQFLWATLTIGSFIFASFLIWNIGANFAPILTGGLIGCLLFNGELLVISGNAAGIAISLCVVAVWCFLRERFVLAGVLCFAISLALKPHDAGLVWLYFLLAGGVYRKRALQTLLAMLAFTLPVVLWVWYVSPHWMQEMRSNILAYSVHGGINDPGPASTAGHGLDMLINLQTVISIFRDDPRFYNLASYLICAPLLLVWAIVTLRFRASPHRAWLGLAAIAALSMLPVYHRQVDAKLLLLTVPACAMLWAEGGRIGRLALIVTTAGFVLTGYLPWFFALAFLRHLHLSATVLNMQILLAVQAFPTPLILLLMSVFYLWVYTRQALFPADPDKANEVAGS